MRLPILFLSVLSFFACSAIAAAHGATLETSPADGATLEERPETISIDFDEAHRVTLLRIVAADGDVITLSADQGRDPVETVTAAAPELAPGGYRLEWRALAADGHPVEGAISFAIVAD